MTRSDISTNCSSLMFIIDIEQARKLLLDQETAAGLLSFVALCLRHVLLLEGPWLKEKT